MALCNYIGIVASENELSNIESTKDVKDRYMLSDKARDAVKLIELAQEGKCGEITHSDFNLVKNHLIVLTALENGQRTGALLNMKLDEFETRHVSEDGTTAISVLNHKTMKSSGAAIIILNAQLSKMFETYVKLFRAPFAKCPNIFIKPNGDPLTHPTFANSIKSQMDNDITLTKI